ncbi:unnamed protein product [Microthlaspi erraticum]|uniref:Uncharacterized protein n=1 Tax=Microthlaspi erraticum TaxID=1685480 RepID=A0A6D2JE88_9BRAS|nr:unnamed protein product [Microthlaspi erraticum]
MVVEGVVGPAMVERDWECLSSAIESKSVSLKIFVWFGILEVEVGSDSSLIVFMMDERGCLNGKFVAFADLLKFPLQFDKEVNHVRKVERQFL